MDMHWAKFWDALKSANLTPEQKQAISVALQVSGLDGKTLRDEFAMRAKVSVVDIFDAVTETLVGRPRPKWKPYMQDNKSETDKFHMDLTAWEIEAAAAIRYRIADAMLEARKQ